MRKLSNFEFALVYVGGGVLLCFCVLMCLGLGLTRMKGVIPEDSQAIAIHDDAMAFWGRAQQASDHKLELPESIRQFDPLSYKLREHGIVIVFGQAFIDEYGFYYTTVDGEGIQWASEIIAPGVYRYYEPD